MKTLNLHTNGEEFYLNGSTEEYIGYYNITDDAHVFTGRAKDSDSIGLTRIPSDAGRYKALTNDLADPITVFVPSPTDADYKRGWFVRYFARQANDINAPYREIDEQQYNEIVGSQKPFYIAVQLRWKIAGPILDILDNITQRIIEPGVFNTNDRSIKLLESIHVGLAFRLQNKIEFLEGHVNPYFGPSLTQTGESLHLE